MTRRTVTLTAPNGAKVRTVRSRRYFVVSYYSVSSTWNRKTLETVHHAPKPVATVEKRTDDIKVADREYRRAPQSRVVFDVSSGEPVAVRGTGHFGSQGDFTGAALLRTIQSQGK